MPGPCSCGTIWRVAGKLRALSQGHYPSDLALQRMFPSCTTSMQQAFITTLHSSRSRSARSLSFCHLDHAHVVRAFDFEQFEESLPTCALFAGFKLGTCAEAEDAVRDVSGALALGEQFLARFSVANTLPFLEMRLFLPRRVRPVGQRSPRGFPRVCRPFRR